jgi:hypothetical protein
MNIITHPLRQGVTQILEQHFAPELVKRFKLEFEANMFQGEHMWKQKKDQVLCLEVRYEAPEGTNFICDVWSYWTKQQTEAHLLRMITDKVRAGEMGKDWEIDNQGRFSMAIASGKYETPDEEIRKGMA